MLKENSKRILDIVAGQTEQNATEAYLAVHPNASRVTATVNAHQLLKKPEAQIYLQKHIDKAKNKVVQLVDSEREEIALKASESVLDRALGKATQRTETTNTSVNLNLNLSDIVPEQQ